MRLFQATVLDPETGELTDARFRQRAKTSATGRCRLRGKVAAVAIEATTGWRWVWRELSALGFDVRLADPVETGPRHGSGR